MQRKPLGLIIFLSTVIALGGGLSAWAGYSQGAAVNAVYQDGQAILPGSYWTPIIYFVIDDDVGIDSDPGDGPVFLNSVSVGFNNGLIPPVGTPSIQPGDIAVVALALDSTNTGTPGVYDPLFDSIIATATLPEEQLDATIFLGPEGRFAADADGPAALQNSAYFVLVKTSSTITVPVFIRTSALTLLPFHRRIRSRFSRFFPDLICMWSAISATFKPLPKG